MIKRVAIGVYSDGFIHAGNLAYLALLSLFPFVIVAAAVARLFGQTEEGMDAVNALLQTMPPDVADVLREPIERRARRRAPAACSGSARWSACGPPAASSRRSATSSAAPMASATAARSGNIGSARSGMIIAAVVLAMIAFSVSILLSGVAAIRRRRRSRAPTISSAC